MLVQKDYGTAMEKDLVGRLFIAEEKEMYMERVTKFVIWLDFHSCTKEAEFARLEYDNEICIMPKTSQ